MDASPKTAVRLDELYRAHLFARNAADDLLQAHAKSAFNEGAALFRMEQARDYLQQCADVLGFDLVKRTTPAEAHERMLELRRAEDHDDTQIAFR